VLMGHGDGTFDASVDIATVSFPWSVAIAELNGDGSPDLLVASETWNAVAVLLGNGDGTFGAVTNYSTGLDPRFVVTGDMNGDGRLDMVTANSASHSVAVLLGNGDGTFGPKAEFDTPDYPQAVAIGDLDRDGILDVAVACPFADVVSIRLGNGDGTLGARVDRAVGNVQSVALRDLDGDARIDLVTAHDSNAVSVALGRGDGTFGATADFGTGFNPASIAIADLNGDGRPDLMVANYSSGTVSVLLNTSGTQPTPTLLGLFSAVSTSEGVRVEWQLDDVNAFRSITLQRAVSAAGEWTNVPNAPESYGPLTVVVDDGGPVELKLWYRLACVQRDGREVVFGPIEASAFESITEFALAPLSPNPSAGRSLVTFAIPVQGHVRLTLTDVQGRELAVLLDSVREGGCHAASLDLSHLQAGMYFVRMQASGVNLSRRVAVVR